MKAKKQVQRQLKRDYRRYKRRINGLLGDYSGTVEVPNRPGYVFVRMRNQEVKEAFNKKVPNLVDLPVIVGYADDPREPQILQVLDTQTGVERQRGEEPIGLFLPPHHETHEWLNPLGGNDVVFSDKRQFMPFRPTPIGGMLLHVYRNVGWLNGEYTFFSGSSIDLSPYVPATGAYLGLVYEDTDATLAFSSGTGDFLKDGFTLTLADIPNPIPGTYPIAAVRMWGGMTGIVEAADRTDLIDLRFPFTQNFLLLSDAPHSYTGSAGKAVSVKSSEDGLEFVTLSAGGTGSAGHVIQDEGSNLTQQGFLNFVGGGVVAVNDPANSRTTVRIPGTVSVFDDGVFQVSGTALDFMDNLDVAVTGTHVFITGQAGGGGATGTFIGLTDTPENYTGASGTLVTVKGDETGLEFTAGVDIASDSADIIAINFLQQVSNPPIPGTNHRIIFAKSNGIFERNDEGDVFGPFAGTGSFLTLTDTPDSYLGQALKYPRVKATEDGLEFVTGTSGGGGSGIDETGWVAAGETWTYASADDPTYTFTISGDLTSKYSAGMRVRLSQSTGGTKYFIITKVSYSAPNTTVTIYGGTDYDLNNEAINSPNYSIVKAPSGFPLEVTKWTARTTDSSLRNQNAPAQNTWYNIGSISLAIPIGSWHVKYKVNMQFVDASDAQWQIQSTLSSANNSESDTDFTTWFVDNMTTIVIPMFVEKPLTLSSKTTYYLNGRTTSAGLDDLYFRGDFGTTIIEAVCAYL